MINMQNHVKFNNMELMSPEYEENKRRHEERKRFFKTKSDEGDAPGQEIQEGDSDDSLDQLEVSEGQKSITVCDFLSGDATHQKLQKEKGKVQNVLRPEIVKNVPKEQSKIQILNSEEEKLDSKSEHIDQSQRRHKKEIQPSSNKSDSNLHSHFSNQFNNSCNKSEISIKKGQQRFELGKMAPLSCGIPDIANSQLSNQDRFRKMSFLSSMSSLMSGSGNSSSNVDSGTTFSDPMSLGFRNSRSSISGQSRSQSHLSSQISSSLSRSRFQQRSGSIASMLSSSNKSRLSLSQRLSYKMMELSEASSYHQINDNFEQEYVQNGQMQYQPIYQQPMMPIPQPGYPYQFPHGAPPPYPFYPCVQGYQHSPIPQLQPYQQNYFINGYQIPQMPHQPMFQRPEQYAQAQAPIEREISRPVAKSQEQQPLPIRSEDQRLEPKRQRSQENVQSNPGSMPLSGIQPQRKTLRRVNSSNFTTQKLLCSNEPVNCNLSSQNVPPVIEVEDIDAPLNGRLSVVSERASNAEQSEVQNSHSSVNLSEPRNDKDSEVGNFHFHKDLQLIHQNQRQQARNNSICVFPNQITQSQKIEMKIAIAEAQPTPRGKKLNIRSSSDETFQLQKEQLQLNSQKLNNCVFSAGPNRTPQAYPTIQNKLSHQSGTLRPAQNPICPNMQQSLQDQQQQSQGTPQWQIPGLNQNPYMQGQQMMGWAPMPPPHLIAQQQQQVPMNQYQMYMPQGYPPLMPPVGYYQMPQGHVQQQNGNQNMQQALLKVFQDFETNGDHENSGKVMDVINLLK